MARLRILLPALGASVVLVLPVLLTATAVRADTAVRITGTLHVEAADTPAGAGGIHTSLVTPHHAYDVHLPTGVTPVSGEQVRISGTLDGRRLDATSVDVLAAAPAVTTVGQQTVYVIRAYWTGNNAPTSPTGVDVTNAFTNASSWFDEVSYGQLPSLTTTVGDGWRHIPTSSCTDPDTLYNNAVAGEQLAHPSFDPTSYDHVAVYFPNDTGCTWSGLGDIGGPRVWLNGAPSWSSLDLEVVVHELGHNLGLWHAHSLTCYTDGSHTTATTISNTCAAPVDYGDPSDVMGGGDLAGPSSAFHYGASQKSQLGWLGSALATSGPCTTVTLKPYETLPNSGDIAARIDDGSDSGGEPIAYWLEYRQATGTADANLPSGLTDGVLLHRTEPTPSGQFLDLGPDLLDGTANTGGNFDDAAITSGNTVTTPDGITFSVTSTSASQAAVNVATVAPSVPTTTAAVRSSGGVTVSWSTPLCLGTSASSIIAYHVSENMQPPVSTNNGTTTSMQFADTPGDGGASYSISATNNLGHTGPSQFVPPSAPSITSSDNYSNFSTLHFAPSVSNGGLTFAYYVLHAEPVNGSDPINDNFYTVGTDTTDTLDLYNPNGLGTYDVTIRPRFTDGTLGPASAPQRIVIGDTAAPTVSVNLPATTLTSSAQVGWSAQDGSGGSGVNSYDVRYKIAPYDGSFGSYVTPKSLQGTTSTSTSISLAAGSTVCVWVRARDNNLNVSGYTKKCSSRPLDDRALHADSNWTQATDSSAYAGTLTTAKQSGATLSLTGVDGPKLSVLVYECSGCGKVAVVVDGTKVATLDLSASSTKEQVVRNVTLPAPMSASTVKLKVTTSGAPVKIDGLIPRAG